jgi:hypothetical protein
MVTQTHRFTFLDDHKYAYSVDEPLVAEAN